ncbi:methyltransferase [Acidiphilium sp.]|uniref:methyltransferase n=1 Tax=Acidiphilium sp. TaxID=527 RepID=UPI003D061AF2
MSAIAPAVSITPLSWRERWQAARNRLLASPRFQQWAAAFPLTRPIARREATALFDLCAGFVYAQTLSACVSLDMFERLAAMPVAIATLAAESAIPPEAMYRLIRAAAALRLLETDGTTARLGPLGAALRGNPGIAAMVRHHALLYRDLADPIALLRGDATASLAAYWPYEQATTDRAAPYSALMAASQPMIAREILAAYDFKPHRCLLDLGGGDGSFLTAVAHNAPQLALMLFDVPPVAALARHKLEAAGLAARSRIHAGDMRHDALPSDADIITLIRVLHDHDDDQAMAILRNARGALGPRGTILIAEPMAGTKGAESMGDAYFGLYLFAMGSGRPRRPTEVIAMLEAAGFIAAKQRRTNQPMLASLITARTA